MFAIVAIVLAVLAGLDVTAGSISSFDFLAFAIAALAAHLAYPVALNRRG